MDEMREGQPMSSRKGMQAIVPSGIPGTQIFEGFKTNGYCEFLSWKKIIEMLLLIIFKYSAKKNKEGKEESLLINTTLELLLRRFNLLPYGPFILSLLFSFNNFTKLIFLKARKNSAQFPLFDARMIGSNSSFLLVGFIILKYKPG